MPHQLEPLGVLSGEFVGGLIGTGLVPAHLS